MAKNDLAPPAGDFVYNWKTKQWDDKRLRSALIELGHAVSKSKLDIASRMHMEVFWELIEERP
jgi:hypothetical protein